jgi:uncharacterized protein YdiU (UPF0061 family)
MIKAAKKNRVVHADDYRALDQLDGSHPWREQVPEGMLLYPVRRLEYGQVSYFNFALAKEMGLISIDHPHRMNKKLEQKLLDTFCLRIINEYDQQKKIEYPAHTIKANMYMATRYLQLQHPDKSGRTSGDGRCIWNGVWSHGGRTWDVSSRGTGVTALAPGVVQAGKPLRSGNFTHGYGCGMAEMDELFGTALMAEILHRNGHPTERMLCLIDLGKGLGIGVRAAPNLIRPAHWFLFLKQSRQEPLRHAIDYFIQRQSQNGTWNLSPARKDRYQSMLAILTESFAKFFAYLDRDFIFAWLDWDGDNVLADGGIIDYGSVRQFGLRHDQYRYDDIERFSTNLNEQKSKARLVVQVFAQMTHFLETGVKKALPEFKHHSALKVFDQRFQHHLLDRFLYQLGFEETMRRLLLNRHSTVVRQFFDTHFEFESVKTHRKMQKVADGVHRPAIFNMRIALARMPQFLLENNLNAIPTREFFKMILSSRASRRDRQFREGRRRRIELWQSQYLTLLKSVSTPQNIEKLLKNMQARAEAINREDRLTGNALINVVDELLKFKKRGGDRAEIQALIDDFIEHQTLNPDFREAVEPVSPHPLKESISLLHTLLTVTYGHREDI